MSEPLYVLGAGSLGLLLAARLSAVADVRLLRRPGRWPERLRLTLHDGPARHELALAQLAPPLDQVLRRVIVATKAYDALPALRGLGEALAPDAALLLMQNGMGSQQECAQAFPRASVYAASTTEGAYRPGPDTVVHAGRGITRAGRIQGAEHDWVGLLAQAGFEAEAAEPIDRYLADKLRINALINPLTVMFDCPNGELLERPAARELMRRLGEETDAILAAAGHRFPDSAYEAAAEVARRTAPNRSSMLQDARAGRRLEIDYINGYLLTLAERHGVAAETQRVVCAQVGRG